MPREVSYRFWIASLLTIASSIMVGYFNVGSLFLFGIPVIPLAISATILWTTRTSLKSKALATLIAILSLPVGFLLFVWAHDVALLGGSWFD